MGCTVKGKLLPEKDLLKYVTNACSILVFIYIYIYIYLEIKVFVPRGLHLKSRQRIGY